MDRDIPPLFRSLTIDEIRIVIRNMNRNLFILEFKCSPLEIYFTEYLPMLECISTNITKKGNSPITQKI